MNKIDTRTAEISLVERGIVRVKFRSDIILGKNDIIENVQASVKLSGGKHCAILETSKNASINDEALRFAESPQNAQYRVANALILKSGSLKLLWHFFNSFFKPKVNNAVFVNEKKAIEWLRSFSDQI
jgi:hypothetical protein